MTGYFGCVYRCGRRYLGYSVAYIDQTDEKEVSKMRPLFLLGILLINGKTAVGFYDLVAVLFQQRCKMRVARNIRVVVFAGAVLFDYHIFTA